MKPKDRLLYFMPLVILGACYFLYRISLHSGGDDAGIRMDKSILVYPVPVEEGESPFGGDDCNTQDATMQRTTGGMER